MRLEHFNMIGFRHCLCSECDWQGREENLKKVTTEELDGKIVQDLHTKLKIGEDVPAGLCPDCGNFVYVQTEMTRAKESVPEMIRILKHVLEFRYIDDNSEKDIQKMLSFVFQHAGISLFDFDQVLYKHGEKFGQTKGEEAFHSLTDEETKMLFEAASKGFREEAIEKLLRDKGCFDTVGVNDDVF